MGDGFIKTVPPVITEDGGIAGNKPVSHAILLNKPGEYMRNGHHKILFSLSCFYGGGEALAENPIRQVHGLHFQMLCSLQFLAGGKKAKK